MVRVGCTNDRNEFTQKEYDVTLKKSDINADFGVCINGAKMDAAGN